MRIAVGIALLLCVAGCASAPLPTCCEDVFSSQGKAYPASTAAQKNSLRQDLRSGKLALGAGVNQVRETYGEAEGVWASSCAVRLRYILPGGNTTMLWFDDGCHLSMWSD